MKLQILSKTDGDLFNGASVAVTFDYTDVAATTSGTAVNVLAVLAGAKVQVVATKVNTPFDVTGTGALTISLGDTSAANTLLPNMIIAQDGAFVLYGTGSLPKAYQANDTIKVTFIDATSMAYTVGSVTVYLSIHNLTDLPI